MTETTLDAIEEPATAAGLLGLSIPAEPISGAPAATFIGLEPADFGAPGGAFINAERLAVREDF